MSDPNQLVTKSFLRPHAVMVIASAVYCGLLLWGSKEGCFRLFPVVKNLTLKLHNRAFLQTKMVSTATMHDYKRPHTTEVSDRPAA